MILYGLTPDLLKSALREANKRFNWNLKFHHVIDHGLKTRKLVNEARLQLATVNNDGKGSRITAKGARAPIQFGCWHAHRELFIQIYALAKKYGLPDIRIVTDQATYKNEKDFWATYEATGDVNISLNESPEEEPLIHRFACECEIPYENTMRGRIDPRKPFSALRKTG